MKTKRLARRSQYTFFFGEIIQHDNWKGKTL